MDDTTGRAWFLRAWAVLVATLLVAPMLAVIPISFSSKPSFKFPPDGYSVAWYQNMMTDQRWTQAIGTSLLVGVLVTLGCTVVGTAAALGIHSFGGRAAALVTGVLIAPMIVPGIVSAVAIYSVYLRWNLTGTLAGFVLAHTVLALPFVVITVTSSLSTTDPTLERAAQILGAGPLRIFFRVTVPGIARGIGAGALFAFVTSFDEVVAASFLQSPAVRTLPIEMFVSVTNEVDPTIAAVSTVVLSLTTVIALLPMLTKLRPQQRHRLGK